MYLTRKHLSRRTLLRGAGVSVGLPLLDAMIPAASALAKTDATTGATPLLRAAAGQDSEAVRLLLEYGGRVDVPNAMGS